MRSAIRTVRSLRVVEVRIPVQRPTAPSGYADGAVDLGVLASQVLLLPQRIGANGSVPGTRARPPMPLLALA